ISDAVQPGRQSAAVADGTSPSGQHEKSSLEGVFSILLMAQYAPADGQDEPAVTLHQRGEGSAVPRPAETLQEQAVLDGADRSDKMGEMTQDDIGTKGGHGMLPPVRRLSL